MDDSHRFSRAFTLRRLPRSLMVAALACLLMAAPAAARALIPSTTTAVSIKITTHPATDARTTTAKFAWKATGTKLSVSCRLGSGKYAKCSKTHTYANMKPGAHSFTVRAVSGKTTRTAVYKWTVDTTAPTAPTVSGGSARVDGLQRHDQRPPARRTSAEPGSARINIAPASMLERTGRRSRREARSRSLARARPGYNSARSTRPATHPPGRRPCPTIPHRPR